MRAEGKCPQCGLVVIKDDEALSIAHEDPECDWFRRLNAGASESRHVNEEALGAHFDALARRRRD